MHGIHGNKANAVPLQNFAWANPEALYVNCHSSLDEFLFQVDPSLPQLAQGAGYCATAIQNGQGEEDGLDIVNATQSEAGEKITADLENAKRMEKFLPEPLDWTINPAPEADLTAGMKLSAS